MDLFYGFSNIVLVYQNALGRVSFTSDIWSRKNLEGYMGVTAHFCADSLDGRLTIQSRLVAFYHVKGIHDGKNLAKIFVQILKELGVLNRVRCSFTAKALSTDSN